MLHLKKLVLVFFLLVSAELLKAQSDSLELICPLSNGTPRVIRASDKDYQKSSEYGVMLLSKTDSLVTAVHDATVIIVTRSEDSKYDVVLQFKNYFFWYAGVTSPRVKSGAKIKSGSVIGTYNPGELLELLMFLQEEPVNPRKYLKCK